MTPAHTVTLFGRPGCTLCLAALEELRPLAKVLGFRLDVVDIEQDEALHRRYLFEIPVVALDGREVAKAPLRGHQLEDSLREALEG